MASVMPWAQHHGLSEAMSPTHGLSDAMSPTISTKEGDLLLNNAMQAYVFSLLSSASSDLFEYLGF